MRQALTNVGGPIRLGGPDRALADILSHAWRSADEADNDALTHGMHAYPARMPVGIATHLIAQLTAPDDFVVDPFCGGGTVLVEAIRAGRHCVGVDLNPLAMRVSEVKTDIRTQSQRRRFLKNVEHIAQASEERVRARVDAVAPLNRYQAKWFDGHVLKELAGLREEILTVRPPVDRRALQALMSAIVVKFSRRRADTADKAAPKRIRKGLVTEFFLRRGREWVARWEELERNSADPSLHARLIEGDARDLPRLLPDGFRANLVLTSPPYGGTYDYVTHHELRYPWLGLNPRKFAQDEIGARRNLNRADGDRTWDRELGDVLKSVSDILVPGGVAVLVQGDAQLEDQRIPALPQIARLAQYTQLEPAAFASQERTDWIGGAPREEHLIALRKVVRR